MKSKIVYNTSGYGLTLGSGFTGGEEEKHVLPHDTTRFEYEYDKNGKIVTKTEFRTEDPYEQYSYNQHGDTLITIQRKFRKFSDQKWKLEEVKKEFADTTIQIIYLRDFDDIKQVFKNNRLVSLIRFKGDEITNKINHSYKMTMDNFGHWVKLKHFEEGELVGVKAREIEYWE